MDKKTSELLETFDIADLSFFLLIAKKKNQILSSGIIVSSNDCFFYLVKYRKTIFE